MRYSLYPDDPRLALEVLTSIGEIQYLGSLNSGGDRFRDWGGVRGPIQYAFSRGLAPRAALCQVLDTRVLLVSGASTPQQFTNVFLGATTADVYRTPFQASPAVWDAVQYLFATLQIGIFPIATKWLLCGFSFGGAIAETMAARLLSLYGGTGQVVCLSIAAPRAGLQALQSACGNEGIRWMNAADPVPYFPPHGEEMEGAQGFYTLTQNKLWNQFIHPYQGLSIYAPSLIVKSPLPLPASPDAALRILQWLTSSNAQTSQQHSITTYASMLRLLTSTMPTPNPETPPVGAAVVDPKSVGQPPPAPQSSTWYPPPLPPPSVTLTQVPGTSSVLDMPGVKPISSLGGTLSMAAYIPPNYRWKWVRIAPGSYVVQWMSLTITKPSTKSNARSVARWGNKMLRSLGTAPGVVQSGIGQAMTAFLASASQSNLGFNPPWIVV
jgi:pimeloyl-ACP methyl ester carboxylesterase